MMQNQLKFFDINKVNFSKVEQVLDIKHGTGKNNGSLFFDFLKHQIKFSQEGFSNLSGEPLTDAVKNVLHQYLLKCPDSICKSSNKLVTLREFSDSGPLFSRFTANINKIIETTFSGQLENLITRCHKLGGIVIDNASYDLSVEFKALSKIPILMNFNDNDDMMPASAVFLFHDNAISYLDLKSLGTLLTYLTGQLIQQ